MYMMDLSVSKTVSLFQPIITYIVHKYDLNTYLVKTLASQFKLQQEKMMDLEKISLERGCPHV